MENTIETNGEPVTIKITIEIIPGKKKEEIAVKAPIVEVPKKETTVEEPEMVFEPMNTPEPAPEKKKRAYTRKAKEVIPPVETPKEEVVVTVPTPVVAPVTSTAVSPTTSNKVVARLAQMIRFYCKASNIPTTEVTKKYLIDHGAADIIEGATEEDIEEAFKEVIKK
jgi:hypothetical protein